MTYTIRYTKKSLDFLAKLSKEDATSLMKKINSISENPIPHLKKLKGSRLWRLRSGKYRAVVDVLIKGRQIIVLRIGKRKNVYD